MHRHLFRTLAALAIGLTGPLPAAGLPLISEVFYDATGSDNGLSFVEIHGDSGPPRALPAGGTRRCRT